MTTFLHELPDGVIATRSSKTKTYTHVVVAFFYAGHSESGYTAEGGHWGVWRWSQSAANAAKGAGELVGACFCDQVSVQEINGGGTCPTCGTAGVLSAAEAAQGFQCSVCVQQDCGV